MIPVILDTDSGSNINDSIALSYLLMQPRCVPLGITTVSVAAKSVNTVDLFKRFSNKIVPASHQ
jgi:inosine-uridine nucleoside N-ribohydrolase